VLILVAFGLAFGSCLAMFGSQAAYYAELFPAAYRFSGFALSREIPGAALAGPAPVIAVGLVALASGSPILLAVAMAFIAVAGFVAVLALPETRGTALTEPAAELGVTVAAAEPTKG
jgi:MFS transporter, MHS family, shikimate and dehydroshikimate transport protein